MIKGCINFIKKEAVLCIAFVIALMSAFFVLPSKEYFKYIDFNVLALLMSLMFVMEGLKEVEFFKYIGQLLLNRVKRFRQLNLIFVLLCFFSSMLITNDVALITFVPFAIEVMSMAKLENKLIAIIVLQTVAANLGSMLTPIGNPQNLYIYSLSGMNIGNFLMCMLPYTIASFVLILASVFFLKNTEIQLYDAVKNKIQLSKHNKIKITIYIALFMICLLSVVKVISYFMPLLIVILFVAFFDRKIFKKIDYYLLLTFICFFIFIGNIKNIPLINEFLKNTVLDRELAIGILSSQIISNVPAAILISGFTKNFERVLIGVNFGGLGTLVASMASLISYKYYTVFKPENKIRYLLYFSVVNIVFLIILLIFYYIYKII